MHDIDIDVTNSHVTIDFSRTGIKTDTLAERTQEIIPVLRAFLAANDAWLSLTDDDLAIRGRGCMAVNIMYQGAIQNATRWADPLMAVAVDIESVASHGFAEFEGDTYLDV